MNTEMNTKLEDELCAFKDGVCVTPHNIMMRNKCIKMCLKWMYENQVDRNDATEEEVDEWDTLYNIYQDTIWMYAEDVLKYGTDDDCKQMIFDWINDDNCPDDTQLDYMYDNDGKLVRVYN